MEATHSIKLNNATATLQDSGSLTLGSTLTLTAGTFTLASGGVLSGGTIVSSGGTFVAAGGTLSGVKYDGTLNLSPNYARVDIANSLTLAGAGGTGAGTVLDTGYSSDFDVLDSMTLNSATIDIGNNNTWASMELGGSSNTLTLGPTLSLVQAGTYAQLYNDNSSNAVVNKGTITAGISGGTFYIFRNQPGTFSNQGTISVSNGDFVNLTNASFNNSGLLAISGGAVSLQNWTNSGTITMSAGSLTLGNGSAGAWSDSGKIEVTGGSLSLGGSFTAAQLKSVAISAGTRVAITGTLNNAGSTLAVGAATFLGDVAFSGTISGGVIADAGGGGLVFNYGTLSGVKYEGTLDLNESNARARIAGSLVLAGAGGSGTGTIQITGYNSDLILLNSGTLNNATLNLGDDGTWAYVELANSTDTLTLGSGLSVVQAGTYAQIYNDNSTNALINKGTITAGFSGGTLYVFGNQYGTLTNQGTISASNGDFINLTNADFVNSGLLSVNDGVVSLQNWSNSGTISMSAGSLTLGNGSAGAWSDNGTIEVTGGTLSLGGSFTAAQLRAVAISIGTTVDITGTLNNASGTLTVGPSVALGMVGFSGTISGGVILDGTGGGLVFNSGTGTLSGVQYDGTMDLSPTNSRVRISGGLGLAGADGTGPGEVLITGSSSDLILLNSVALNDAELLLGNNYGWSYMEIAGSGDTLTLGATSSLVQAGLYAQIYNDSSSNAFVNKGTITAGIAGGTLDVFGNQYGTLTNQGTISVSNGDFVNLTNANFSNPGLLAINGGVVSLQNWSNGGTITMSAGSLTLGNGSAGAWSDKGTIEITGGSVRLGEAFTTAQLQAVAISAGTSVDITGTLNNTGTLLVGSGTDLGDVGFSGTIAGGVISDAFGGGISSYENAEGTLSGVAYQGTLDLSENNARIRITGGLSLTGAGGSGLGTVLVTGDSSDLLLLNSTTLNDATVDFGNDSSWSYIELAGGSNTLTLGSTLSLVQTGIYGQIYNDSSSNALINKGTISAGVAGGTLDIFANQYGTLTNLGTIAVSNSDLFDLYNTDLTNLTGTTITGGTFIVGTGADLQLNNNETITVDQSFLELSGAGSTIQSYSNSSKSNVSLDSTLSSIGAGGTLALLDGRNFTVAANSGTFGDTGTLLLGDTTFSAATLTVNGGTLAGSGTIDATLATTGTANIAGGGLVLDGAVSGTGNLAIAAGGALTLEVGSTFGGVVTDAGTLQLAGVTFTAGSATLAAGGVLAGFGTMGGAVTDGGLVDANGGTLLVAGLAGLGGGTWSGGGLEADAGSALQLANNANLATDAGSITLSGAGSVIEWLNTTSDALVSLDTTLAAVSAGGTLSLANGRNFTATANHGTFSDSGAVVLAGDTFTATKLTLGNGGSIVGSGTISGPIAVSGTATVSGGTLALAGAVSGTGTLNVADGSLQLTGSAFGGTRLAIAASGTLTGFGTVTSTITDAGLVDANGGTLSVAGLAGISGGTLSAGQLEADTGATLQLAANTQVTADAGGITLSGPGSVIQSLKTTTNKQVSLDSTLATISAGGALTIENGRTFTAVANSGSFTDSGTLLVSGGTFSAASLKVTSTGVVIDAGTIAGAISNAGTVSIVDGTSLVLASGGSLGGTFTGAGTLELSGSTAFTLLATAALSTSLLQVDAGASLSGAGTLTVPLTDNGTVTASGGTLVLEGAISGSGTLSMAAGATLQLADGGEFDGVVSGAGSLINADFINGGTQGVALSGSGTVSLSNGATAEIYAGNGDGADLAGSTMTVGNAGAIDGTRHGLTLSGSSATVTNSGLISADSGAAILASGPGSITIVNTGLIVNYESSGAAAISMNGASSATVTNAGTIIGGYYETEPTAAIQFGAGNDRLIIDPGAVFIGAVNGAGGSNTMELAAGASASAPGTISEVGTSFTRFGSIVEDANAAWTLSGTNSLSAGTTVSLAAGSVLTLAGSMIAANGVAVSGSGSLTIADDSLVDVSTGATLTLSSALANLAGGTLTGGTFEVDTGATLQLAANANVVTDNADIVLNGAGGTIQWTKTGGTTATLPQNLNTIGATGTLQVLGGASFAASGSVSDQGLLQLGGGAWSGGTLAVAATGTAIGTGTIGSAVSDQGLVEASGGTLALSGSIGGAGMIGIDANSVLSATGTVSAAGLSFLGSSGTLDLSQPGSFSAAISGFATSDTIDLIGKVVTSLAFNNDTLTVTGSTGTIASLLFSGDYSGYHFGHYADGNGGTNILLT